MIVVEGFLGFVIFCFVWLWNFSGDFLLKGF